MVAIMKKEEKERLKQFVSFKGTTIQGLEKMIGKSNGYLNNVKSLSSAVIGDIVRVYPDLNADWLITGEGEPVKVDEDTGQQDDGSPYFDNFTIQAGSASGFGDESAIKPTGYMNIPGVSSSGGTFFIKVRGESMLNRSNPQRSIPEGSWVALRKVTTSSIQWGEVYAFMTTDGPLVKRIMPSDKEGYIKCVSFNEEGGYSPFELPVREIINGDFFMVTAVVNINIL